MIPIFIIIMNKDKSLTITSKTKIYRKENMVDKMKFLFPEKYQDLVLSECIATLKYMDVHNVPHAEILKKDKGINLNTLRNSEKAEIIGALKKISAERTPLCSTYVQKQLLLPGKSSPRPG